MKAFKSLKLSDKNSSKIKLISFNFNSYFNKKKNIRENLKESTIYNHKNNLSFNYYKLNLFTQFSEKIPNKIVNDNDMENNKNKNKNGIIHNNNVNIEGNTNVNINVDNNSNSNNKNPNRINNNSNSKKFTEEINDFIKYFSPYLNRNSKTLIISISLIIMSKGMITMSSYFLKLVIEAISAHKHIYIPISFLLSFLLVRILGYGLNEYKQIKLNKVSNDIIVNFNRDMIKYLFKLDFQEFKNNSNQIITRMNKSIEGIDHMSKFLLGNIFANIVEFGIVSCTLYYFMGYKYCIIIISTYVAYIYSSKIIMNKRIPIIREKHNSDEKIENKLSEIVYNIDSIKYFSQEKKEEEIMINNVNENRKLEVKVIKSLAVLNSVQYGIISLGMFGCLYFGIYDCYSGKMSPGDLIMLQSIFAQIMQPLFTVGTLMRTVTETRIKVGFAIDAIKHSKLIMENEKTLVNVKNEFIDNNFNIEFKNVHFSYNNKGNYHEILKGVDMIFKTNEITAIVGKSGQGKSTIFNLIVSFLFTLSTNFFNQMKVKYT